ncbi:MULTISPECIES: Rossmann-like and DUF2520 domain-containing protein [Frigoribacterium]|uniref:Rossmann-like and DUF2520 domain-containing protein n=1 Tax=Frigoribacterium TaxID=96492 RepID=UPI001781A304|nr:MULTISPECIES: Rossmann-like and DUF2520 domain-containing protein [Frigoribacterium]MBD8704887.1 DUF2520 domain-containing protein [Frigoribacterium sp. CFBP 13712]MCJ0702020.1 DUF2520 domain-containing protein [Frigoribacterium faeni]MDY0891515.1 Rossmann-like and DUF2520 domain-containing protein [Frigoribacterium sp. CFBP9030]
MSAQRSGRLGVGVIGAGHVGPILGAALAAAGHAVVGISAVSERARDRAEAILPGVPVLTVQEVVERSELVLLAVPDDQLPDLVAGLAETGGWQPGQLVVHTSAVHGLEVLRPALAAGVIPLAIHPALTFTGTTIDLVRLRGAYCAVTAPVPVQPIGQALVVEMGAEPVLVADADRPRYAEAVATATEFSAAIVTQSVGLLAELGMPEPGRVIAPLVRSAMDRALGIAEGSVGPGTIDVASFDDGPSAFGDPRA